MAVLVTGVAGFIGMHVAKALLARGESVVGIDNLNDYYDVALKENRLREISGSDRFAFHRIDVSDQAALGGVLEGAKDVDRVIHLAAQAGVRYSLDHPEAYVQANLLGQFAVLEAVRHHPGMRHLVYASSSSVYGANTELPFSVEQKVDKPMSLYAATKASAELMARCYSSLYRIPMTGLRFFTVYGPWGRPDMSAFIFARALYAGEEIPIFNHGDMRRDFTYIDDIVAGVIAALDRPPADGQDVPHRRYNLGNHRSEKLLDFVSAIEQATGKKARIRFEEMQPGDVPETYADIEASQRDLGFEPATTIWDGVPRFVEWFRAYHKL